MSEDEEYYDVPDAEGGIVSCHMRPCFPAQDEPNNLTSGAIPFAYLSGSHAAGVQGADLTHGIGREAVSTGTLGHVDAVVSAGTGNEMSGVDALADITRMAHDSAMSEFLLMRDGPCNPVRPLRFGLNAKLPVSGLLAGICLPRPAVIGASDGDLRPEPFDNFRGKMDEHSCLPTGTSNEEQDGNPAPPILPQFDDEYDAVEPSGALANCECSQCREARLHDEDRLPGVWDEVIEWVDGWLHGRC